MTKTRKEITASRNTVACQKIEWTIKLHGDLDIYLYKRDGEPRMDFVNSATGELLHEVFPDSILANVITNHFNT